METNVDELCQDQPPEFIEYMNYCREGLSFTDDPNYQYMIGLFIGCMARHNYELSTPEFIWNNSDHIPFMVAAEEANAAPTLPEELVV